MDGRWTRRTILGTASAGVLAATTLAEAGSETGGATPVVGSRGGFTKTRVLRVFIGVNPAWPKPDLDLQAEAKRLQAGIDQVPGLEDVEFVSNALVRDADTLAGLLKAHKDVDGILAVQICLGTWRLLTMMADSGIPTVVFATPFSGHEWCMVPDMQRAGKKLDVIPTSNLNDVLQAIRPLRAIHRLKETRILHVGGGMQIPEKYAAEAKQKLGVEIVPCDHKRLNEAFEAMPAAAVEKEADRWVKQAERVVEPSREEIVKASRLCLAMLKVLADEKAQAMTINCLGLFGVNGLPAYPCFGFVRLNDLGLVGVCEADLPSTLTQVIYQHMVGKPGFVTDPVIDTSNDTLIHAHCVAATRMDGPQGESAPYVIRSHLEDHKGAVLQTKMRVGQEITMAKLVGGDLRAMAARQHTLAASPAECYGVGTMLVSTGKIVDIPDVDRGCRTKITVKVRDARKIFEGWSHGLHRVIFYGNHLADTRRLARFIGVDVFEEG
ncbi:MAG TPA: hypothetical protein PKY77_22250 [Phycisphaerae bacterium]|nr:hypothetical protein [Phycisphaerae bacterium]HRY68295.1 hypothetical protein [Phycisphaerae bacterium]HSA26822.1 hypothetical protein [Phycisphaerae bacterium]